MATAGYRVYDPSGNLLLDGSIRTGRAVGYVTVNSNGSISVPALVGKQVILSITNLGGGQIAPVVTVNGSGVVTWDYGTATSRMTTQIIYGAI